MIERRKPKAARKLYRRATAAAMLDTSVSMLKKLEHEGKRTPVRLGSRDVFYKAEQVEALAEGDATE